jgi:hypothetical protein
MLLQRRGIEPCDAPIDSVLQLVGAARAERWEKTEVYAELLDQSVAMFVSVLEPFTAASAQAAVAQCIGLVGAGEGLSAAIIRGKLSEEAGIAAFVDIIQGSLAQL